MTEDPDSKAQDLIKDHAKLTREVLAVRLVAFRPGLGEVHGFGDLTVKLYEEGFVRNPDDTKVPFFITVSRKLREHNARKLKEHPARKLGERYEQSTWKFMPDNTVERSGMVIKDGVVTKYGKGFSDVPTHSVSDAEILSKLAVDPIANFSLANDLSFIDGRPKSLRTGPPARSVGRRL